MSAKEARVVLITGVSRGIGRGLALELAQMGHTILGCARDPKLVRELATSIGPKHDAAVVDVTSDAEVSAWIRRIVALHGAPDLVINNAALMNRNAPLWTIAASEFDAVVDVNVKGVANVVRHVLPPMIARTSGVIVNMSSGWGRSVSPNVAPYCATKFAVEGLTRALALELPKGLAAIALGPGTVDTDMLRRTMGDAASNSTSPAEWARKAAPFLLALGPEHNGRSLDVRA